MTLDEYAAYAPEVDPAQAALSKLVAMTCEEAIFGLSAALGNAHDALEDLVKRRKDAHQAALAGQVHVPRMIDSFDGWVVEMTRAIAPICPPSWMPMSEVIAREGDARGRRARPPLALLVEAERQGRAAREAPRHARRARPSRGASPRTVRSTAKRRARSRRSSRRSACPTPTRSRSTPRRRSRSSSSTSTAKSTARSRARSFAARGSPRRGTRSIRAKSTSSARSRRSSRPASSTSSTCATKPSRASTRGAWRASRRSTPFASCSPIACPASASRSPRSRARSCSRAAIAKKRSAKSATARRSCSAQRYKGISGAEKASAIGIAWAAALFEDPSIARQAILARAPRSHRARSRRRPPRRAPRGRRHDRSMSLAETAASVAVRAMIEGTLGFIGAGNMAGALIKGLLHSGTVHARAHHRERRQARAPRAFREAPRHPHDARTTTSSSARATSSSSP